MSSSFHSYEIWDFYFRMKDKSLMEYKLLHKRNVKLIN